MYVSINVCVCVRIIHYIYIYLILHSFALSCNHCGNVKVINVGVNIAVHHSGAFIVLYVWLQPLLVHTNLLVKALLFEVACCRLARLKEHCTCLLRNLFHIHSCVCM